MNDNASSAVLYPPFSENCRAHPLTVLSNLRRVFFLALIPLIRAAWFSLVWQDVLAILLILALAVLAWLRVRFRYGSECLVLQTGLLLRRVANVPWSRVTAVSFFTHFSYAPFRAVRLRVETLGGCHTVLVSQKQADELKPFLSGSNGTASVYRPTRARIAALSLLTSNSFGGIIYLSMLVSQSGKLLGRAFSGAVHAAFERAASLLPLGLALGLPPVASAVAVLLLAGWLIGFGRMFLRCHGFAFLRRGGLLSVSGGFVSRYERHMRHVFSADMRQSLITKLLGLYSLYIRGMCVLFTEKAGSFAKNREALLPEFPPAPREIKPPPGALLRFIGLPLLALAAVWPVFRLLVRVYPGFGASLVFAAFMAAALVCWFLAVKLTDYFTSGVSFSGKCCTLRYAKGLAFHTVIIPMENLSAMEIRQSPLMRLGPYCDFIVHTKQKSLHCCRGLLKKDVIDCLGRR